MTRWCKILTQAGMHTLGQSDSPLWKNWTSQPINLIALETGKKNGCAQVQTVVQVTCQCHTKRQRQTEKAPQYSKNEGERWRNAYTILKSMYTDLLCFWSPCVALVGTWATSVCDSCTCAVWSDLLTVSNQPKNPPTNQSINPKERHKEGDKSLTWPPQKKTRPHSTQLQGVQRC